MLMFRKIKKKSMKQFYFCNIIVFYSVISHMYINLLCGGHDILRPRDCIKKSCSCILLYTGLLKMPSQLTFFFNLHTVKNLDVNMAVNNLLSRDDEGEGDDDDSQDSNVPDDLISLLDSGVHEHPSVIIDADAMFNEDVFGYSSLRNRGSGNRTRIGRMSVDFFFSPL